MQVERTTNHDVKAIEYVLKEKFRQHEELNKVLHVCSLHPFSRPLHMTEISIACFFATEL